MISSDFFTSWQLRKMTSEANLYDTFNIDGLCYSIWEWLTHWWLDCTHNALLQSLLRVTRSSSFGIFLSHLPQPMLWNLSICMHIRGGINNPLDVFVLALVCWVFRKYICICFCCKCLLHCYKWHLSSPPLWQPRLVWVPSVLLKYIKKFHKIYIMSV